jgi:hypothetical protein
MQRVEGEDQSRYLSWAEVQVLTVVVTLVYAGWFLSSTVLAGQARARHPSFDCGRCDHQTQDQWEIRLACEALLASLVA